MVLSIRDFSSIRCKTGMSQPPLSSGEVALAWRVLGIDPEGCVEGVAGHQDGQPVVQDQQRLPHRFDNDLRERAGIFDPVEERSGMAVFPVTVSTLGAIGTNSKNGTVAPKKRDCPVPREYRQYVNEVRRYFPAGVARDPVRFRIGADKGMGHIGFGQKADRPGIARGLGGGIAGNDERADSGMEAHAHR